MFHHCNDPIRFGHFEHSNCHVVAVWCPGYPYNGWGGGGGGSPQLNSAIWCLTTMKLGSNRLQAKNFSKQQKKIVTS